MQEDAFKRELIRLSALMEEKGFVNMLEGNLSVLDRERGLLYITPSGTRKTALAPSDIAVLRNGEQIAGALPHSSEYLLHEAAYGAKESFRAVIHSHAPYLSAYAYCGRSIDLRCSTVFAALHTFVPCLPYGEPGTKEIAKGLHEALQTHSLVLLANHGVVCAAESLDMACGILESTEAVMRVYHLAAPMGVRDLPEEALLHYRSARAKMLARQAAFIERNKADAH